jgi:hypothetical protein
MSYSVFSDDCPGCRPALIDLATGKPYPPDSPMMQAMDVVWASLTLDQKKSFHRATCLNSRAPTDLLVMRVITERFKTAMDSLEHPS